MYRRLHNCRDIDDTVDSVNGSFFVVTDPVRRDLVERLKSDRSSGPSVGTEEPLDGWNQGRDGLLCRERGQRARVRKKREERGRSYDSC